MTSSDQARALVGVIADDLTGANATGILLRRRGFRTASLPAIDWPPGGLVGFDCAAINTESRAVPPQEAYNRVTAAAQLLTNNKSRPLAKRIDSTLRGNLGPELEAILAALGAESIAVVTGAYPSSGRTTKDGYHYVNGVLLAETAVRHDPLCPVTESHVPTLLKRQTQLPIGTLPLHVIREGVMMVADALRRQAATGIRLFCADAETDQDILILGAGIVASGLTAVAADPGPLTAAYVDALVEHRRERVLVVAGSVSPNTREQLANLQAELSAVLITVDAAALAQGHGSAAQGHGSAAQGHETAARGQGAAADEITRIVAELRAVPHHRKVLGVISSPLITLPDHTAAEAIAAGFAEIAARSLDAMPDIAGLYTSGGDITLAVCRRLGARAINLVAEVLPLAVAGRLLGGRQPGLPIVTKGGLVGGPDAAVRCVSHILKEVHQHD